MDKVGFIAIIRKSIIADWKGIERKMAKISGGAMQQLLC